MSTTPAQPLTDERVQEIEKRRQRIHAPWQPIIERDLPDEHVPPYLVITGVLDARGVCVMTTGEDEDYNPLEAEFIAHAPSDIDYLLQKVRNLETSSRAFETLLADSQQDTVRLNWLISLCPFIYDRANIDATMVREARV